jgi:nicotinamidase-related amidase
MTHVAGTTPYAWPYDGRLDPGCTALVITGADRHTAGRVPADPVASAALDRLRTELAAAGVLVVLVGHDLAGVAGSHGATPSPEPAADAIEPRSGELVITAMGHDGFHGSPLDTVLRRHGRTHLLVAGIGFETTVHSTLRRANDRGYECLVLADACLSGDPSLRTASVSSIEMSGGIFGAVGATPHVLTAFTATRTQEPS